MKKFSFALLLCIIFTACNQNRTPYFIQISDPQLGFINKSDDVSPERDLMLQIIGKANGLKPDFIVFSGDFVHWRIDTNALKTFDTLRNMFNKEIPIYYLPGNHDVGNEAESDEVAAFVRRYGHDRFVHQEKEYTVIGYNSCVIKANTAEEPDEYMWLEEQLGNAKQTGRPIIVVSHHPVFTQSPDEKESYENLPVPMREKYLELFNRYGVEIALAGHLHKCAKGEYNNIEFVTSGAAGRSLGKDPSGYTIVTIMKNRIVTAYHDAVTGLQLQPSPTAPTFSL